MRKELKYYGLQSALSLFEKRKEDIIKVYLHKSNLSHLKSLLKWCSLQKKAYHMVENEDLEKLTDSHHHEGVCVLAKEKGFTYEEDFFAKVLKKGKECIL